jgi:hypothetical protein
MLFMVIERYKNRDANAVYQRFRERGRMLPEGLKYIDSWVEPDYGRCFQLMSCDDAPISGMDQELGRSRRLRNHSGGQFD